MSVPNVIGPTSSAPSQLHSMILCITETKVSQGGVNLARNDRITDLEMNNFFRFRAYFLANGGLLALDISHRVLSNRPIRLTQCCTQFKSPGVKILCVLYLHYNVAFTFK